MKSSLKERIRRRETLHGIFVALPSPGVVEMAGYAGFDFVILDTEHSPATSETLENQLRAADVAGVPALVRVSNRTPPEILRCLEAGACGIIGPHVITANDAKSLVAAAHYPPFGIRGLALSTRAGRHGITTLAEHLAKARETTVVIAQIEDSAALDNVTEIAATPELDAVFIGPVDLSASLGFPGQTTHPKVTAAVERIIADVKKVNGALVNLGGDATQARELAAQGINLICFSTSALFSKALVNLVREVKQTA